MFINNNLSFYVIKKIMTFQLNLIARKYKKLTVVHKMLVLFNKQNLMMQSINRFHYFLLIYLNF